LGITIKDVAKRVGVTPATVSMVINNKPRISEATRNRVLEAIRELDYYPHAGARNLVLKRTSTIGVAASFFTYPFILEILTGIELELRQTEYNMVLFGTRGLAKTEDSVIHSIARERKVDGLITITLDLKENQVEDFRKNNLSIVALERDYKGVDCVVVNNEKGAFDATRHLAQLGHKRIGLVNGLVGHPGSDERQRGYERAILESGLILDKAYWRHIDNFSRKEGFEAAQDLMSVSQAPTAIFVAAGDLAALGVIQALGRMGKRVPEDVSVVGYDDIPLSEMLEPGLTTVRQPMQQIGAQAFKQLLSSIKEGTNHQPFKMVYDAELIVRQSTGPCTH